MRTQTNKQIRGFALSSALILTLLSATYPQQTEAENAALVSPVFVGSVSEQYLLAAANRERLNRGLHPLGRDPDLARAAEYHARRMADHADISHGFPGEPELAARAANAGVRFSLISENVAEAPDSVQIHDMLMHSEGHRENLLDPEVNVAGISVVLRDGQLYAVEDFASTVEALTLSQQESTVATLMATSGIRMGDGHPEVSTAFARQTCIMSTGYAGPRKPWFVMRYTVATLSQLPAALRLRLNSGKYHQASVGACPSTDSGSFSSYNIAVLLYP